MLLRMYEKRPKGYGAIGYVIRAVKANVPPTAPEAGGAEAEAAFALWDELEADLAELNA